jgi:hypothetical protein
MNASSSGSMSTIVPVTTPEMSGIQPRSRTDRRLSWLTRPAARPAATSDTPTFIAELRPSVIE